MVFTKAFDEPAINKREILRYVGVACEADEMNALLDSCLAEALPLLTYKVCFSEFNIKCGEGYIDLGFANTESIALEKNLCNCDSIILFAATVGIELDRLIARYSAVAPSRAIMLHAIGNERVEGLCDAFCAYIRNERELCGQFVRPRFSPGYGGFSLEVQRDIFLVLECNKKIGLTLNESLLMTPSKSVTAVIGIGRKEK